MPWCTVVGIFKAVPVAWKPREGQPPSLSTGIEIDFGLTHLWEPLEKKWLEWAEGRAEIARGTIWFQKRDGTVDDNKAQLARTILNWDGDFAKLEQGAGLQPPSLVYVETREELYGGKKYFRVDRMSLMPLGDGQEANRAARLNAKIKGKFLPPEPPVAPPTPNPEPLPPGDDIPF